MPLMERVNWYNTLVFFRLMVRLKFLTTSEKWLMMCCRASSMWVRGVLLGAEKQTNNNTDIVSINRTRSSTS